MSKTYTAEELNTLSSQEMSQIILSQQEQIKSLNDNFERLIEQLRIANQQRFGRHSEKLDVIDGQMCLFDEAEAVFDPEASEPAIEETVKSYRRKKQAGKRDADLRSGNQRFRLVDEPEELLRARVDALREMLHPAFPAFEKRRLDLCEERAEKNASDEQQA